MLDYFHHFICLNLGPFFWPTKHSAYLPPFNQQVPGPTCSDNQMYRTIRKKMFYDFNNYAAKALLTYFFREMLSMKVHP